MFDPRKRHHRIAYAQNFLKSPALARYVVGLAKLQPDDAVIEIGPGRGILTKALLNYTHNLVLVEKDPELYQTLYKTYQNEPTIQVINTDVLKLDFALDHYKVFANPPFTILSQVVKKFVYRKNSPSAMFLFMQKEAQRRLSGQPTENQFSILIKTWYDMKELHQFQRTDFTPVPAVDVNLVGFYKKANVAIDAKDKHEYLLFVQYGYQQQKTTLAKNLEHIFTHEQWKRLAANLKFSLKCKTTDLTPEQWGGLFSYYKTGVSPDKQRLIQTFKPRH